MAARNLWDEIPATVPGTAAQRQLGAARYAFRAQTSSVAWWGSFMLLLVTAFCVMMVFVISGESEWTNAILFIILGGGSFLGAIAVPLAARFRPVAWCAVFDRGVVYQYGSQPPIAGAWDEITGCQRHATDLVRNGVKMSTTHSVYVQMPAGNFMVSGDTPGAQEIGSLIANGWAAVQNRIAEEDATARLAELAELLQTGARVEFGPFTVSLAGLEHGGTVLDWKRISEVELMGSTICVVVTGERKPVREPVSSMPDPVLFLTVADAVLRAARQAR
ncbi:MULTISPECIES: DUF6585 family protein [unclassified Streptomyces]|uniref:DUF6585 family protein n=1 Tax=unclassified Streptomyces TaxID=2593676 RepID=UPI00070B246F|nr:MULTISPECIES: DUF6585 family protein [unclassified Streptomyces]KRD13167.1 hypothetical protein ASE41_27390 [Streptomyces sp. Root264]